MKIFASSVLLFAYPLEEVFQISKDLGYDGVEVWHFHQIKTNESPVRLRELAEKLDLDLSVHGLSWDLNFTSKLSDIREASLLKLQEGIALAKELGAPFIVIHPGRITVPKDSEEPYWGYLVEGVTRLAEYAKPMGVNISLEIMEHIPKEFFITPEDASRLIEYVPCDNLSITFDAAHVPWGTDPVEYLLKIPRVKHIHLSDADSETFHLPLGHGKRNFSALLTYIRANLKDISIAIEGIEYQKTIALAAENKQWLNSWLSTT